MSDYIKREDAFRVIEQAAPFGNTAWVDKYTLKERIKAVHAADVVECKTGRWRVDSFLNMDGYSCSECYAFNREESPYCPYCGAKLQSSTSNDSNNSNALDALGKDGDT